MRTGEISSTAEHVTGRREAIALIDQLPSMLRAHAAKTRSCLEAGGHEDSAYRMFVAREGQGIRGLVSFVREPCGRMTSLGSEFGHPADLVADAPRVAVALGATVRASQAVGGADASLTAGPYVDDDHARAFGDGLGMTPVAEQVRVVRMDGRGGAMRYLSDNKQKSIRRNRNLLQRESRSGLFLTAMRTAEVEEWMPGIRAIKRERLEAHDLTWADARLLNLWERRVRAVFTAGSARLDILLIDDDVAAYNVSVVQGDVWAVREGYASRRWARFGPGRLLEAHLLGIAIGEGMSVVDWMTSAAPEALLASNDAYGIVSFTSGVPGL